MGSTKNWHQQTNNVFPVLWGGLYLQTLEPKKLNQQGVNNWCNSPPRHTTSTLRLIGCCPKIGFLPAKRSWNKCLPNFLKSFNFSPHMAPPPGVQRPKPQHLKITAGPWGKKKTMPSRFWQRDLKQKRYTTNGLNQHPLEVCFLPIKWFDFWFTQFLNVEVQKLLGNDPQSPTWIQIQIFEPNKKGPFQVTSHVFVSQLTFHQPKTAVAGNLWKFL